MLKFLLSLTFISESLFDAFPTKSKVLNLLEISVSQNYSQYTDTRLYPLDNKHRSL